MADGWIVSTGLSAGPVRPTAFPFMEPSLLMDSFKESILGASNHPAQWADFLQATLREASDRPRGAVLTPLDRVFLYALTEVALRSDRADGVEPILEEHRRAHPDDFLLDFLAAKLHNALGAGAEQRESLVRDILARHPSADEVPFEWKPPRRHDPPLISIAVSTWNRHGSLRSTLEALRAHTRLPYEVVVFDNHSSDGTPDYLRSLQADWPELGLLISEGHRYNVSAFSLAFSFCSGRVIGPICDDVRVLPGWDTALADELARSPAVGAAHPLVLNEDGTIFFYEGGLPQSSRLHPWISARDPAEDVEGKTLETAGLPSASRRIAAGIYPFVRRELLRGIRMFDTRYLHHWADYDLTLQIRQKGYEVRLIPGSRVVDTRQPHHTTSTRPSLIPSELADLFYDPAQVLPRLQSPPSPFWRLQRDRLLFECKWASVDPRDPL